MSCNDTSFQQAALSNTKSYLSPAIDNTTMLNLSAASKFACPIVKTGASSPATAKTLLATSRKLWWEGRICIYRRHSAFCLNASTAMSRSCRRLVHVHQHNTCKLHSYTHARCKNATGCAALCITRQKAYCTQAMQHCASQVASGWPPSPCVVPFFWRAPRQGAACQQYIMYRTHRTPSLGRRHGRLASTAT